MRHDSALLSCDVTRVHQTRPGAMFKNLAQRQPAWFLHCIMGQQ